MELEDQRTDDYIIIAIDGNIVLEDTAKLKEHVELFIEDTTLNGIIIDCGKVKFIDSSGLGLIVSIYKTLNQMQKKFALAALSERTMEIFTLTKLDKILTITESPETALAAFAG